MYDFWLGGHDNFAADRAAALKVSAAAPEAQLMAENRKFLRRAVRYLAAEAGITQFVDIGTGLPTQGNVHQVVQEINPDARVVYVDNDPMVLAHSRALKTGGNTVVIEADLRNPQAILDHPGARKLIDFGQPLVVLLVAVLHFISDDDNPPAIVAAIIDALPPDSYLVLSHVTSDIRRESAASAAASASRSATARSTVPRCAPGESPASPTTRSSSWPTWSRMPRGVISRSRGSVTQLIPSLRWPATRQHEARASWRAGIPCRSTPVTRTAREPKIDMSACLLRGYVTRLKTDDRPGQAPVRACELDMPAPGGISGSPLFRPVPFEVVGVVYGEQDQHVPGRGTPVIFSYAHHLSALPGCACCGDR